VDIRFAAVALTIAWTAARADGWAALSILTSGPI
jgi:hypothetical protein